MAKRLVTVDYVIRLESGNLANQLSTSPRIAGDIVAVKARPHNGFGRRICPPTYGILTVTGMNEEKIPSSCVRHHAEVDESGRTEKWRVRSGNWINIDNLPAQARAALAAGALSITADEFWSRCNDRIATLRALDGK